MTSAAAAGRRCCGRAGGTTGAAAERPRRSPPRSRATCTPVTSCCCMTATTTALRGAGATPWPRCRRSSGPVVERHAPVVLRDPVRVRQIHGVPHDPVAGLVVDLAGRALDRVEDDVLVEP